MRARVHITLKNGVLDPEGKAIATALESLGFSGVNGVRKGTYLEIDLDSDNPDSAREELTSMCEKLLANTVIERYQVDLDADGSAPGKEAGE